MLYLSELGNFKASMRIECSPFHWKKSATLNIVYSVTYYLKSRFLPTKVKLVVWRS